MKKAIGIFSAWRRLALLGFALMAAMAVHAGVTCLFEGATMKVLAPASHVGAHLVLLWDATDKGNDPAAWANSHEIAAEVPAGGAQYAVDLASLGIKNGTPCRIVVYDRYRLLDMLKMPTSKTYIDTGIKDSDCYGVYFGFYGDEKSADFANFIGTSESSGFTVGANSSSVNSWYWYYRNAKYNPRPSVNTASINEASFANQTFTLNGSIVKSDLPAGSVGASGANMFLGTWGAKNRYLYGWWSYVRFTGENGDTLLDYIPVQRGDGVVGFWNRVTDKLVTSTGGGAFTAGTVTNEGFEVVISMQRVTPNHQISLELTESRLYANVPSGLASEQLLLVWDDADKGNDVDAWANSHELAAVVGANGGKYCADLARLGVRNGQTCRVFARHNLHLLDMLEMPNSTTYVNTGVKENDCYGVRFGFYGTGISANYGNVIGTSDSGFTVGADGSNIVKWYWCYHGKKDSTISGSRPSVSTNSINDVAFTNRVFTVNGTVVKSGLDAGAVGETGATIFLGRYSGERYHYGWWSYVRFDDASGTAILDYIPAQRITDGKVGFYDRATGRFVASTGSGAFNAGTVTNASWTAVNSSIATVVRGVPFLDVALDGTSLTVTAPSGLAGEQLVLLWDDLDKGGDPTAWANSEVLAASLSASGGTYSVNLATLGIGRGHVCRVATVNQVQLLDMLKMPNTTTYVDTGIPDSRCYGVRLGFYGNEGHTSNSGTFQNFVGTMESITAGHPCGFTVGMNNTRFDSWYWIYRSYKSDAERPTVYTNAINDVAFTNQTLVVNGVVKKTGLEAGAVGETGRNMYIGTFAELSRFLFGWWSYVRFDDEAGNAIIDYIPAKRAADGKVGFLDRATGAFIVSTGNGNFTAGTTTNDSFSAEHLWRTVPLGDIVATATWTGTGALDDPANWACTNLYGEEVSGLPGEYTAVTIPSVAGFNCPVGSPFACKTISVGGALASDRDWRGLDFAAVSGTIDLAGHTLQVAAWADMARAAEVTDTIGDGELHVEVASPVVVSNTAVAFTGAFKLVKEGDGRFVAAKTGQTYSGGTDVVGGTFACGGNGTNGVYGVAGTTNTVFAGATFDCNEFGEHWQYPFVLAGGTLRDPWRVADITLTDDSFIEETIISRPALANMNFAEATLEMNGHTLTFDIGAGQQCALVNLTVTGGGTILGRSGGFLRLGYDTRGAGVRAAGTVLDISHSLRVDAESTFLDYISRYDNGGYDNGASNVIKVVRRFCPIGNRWHSVELQDGAILDLSHATGVWEATSHGAHFDGTSTLSFAPGATITVDMGERTPAQDDQLTAWSSRPQNVTFTWNLPLPLCALRAGLFAKRDPGCTIIFR